GARVRIEGPAGARVIEVTDLLRDFYETSLAPDELVSDVAVPIPPHGTRGAYLKFVTRSAEDRPCVGVAAFARHGESGRRTGLRVAVGAVGGRPLRLEQIEAQAMGLQPTDGLFRSVGEAYAAAAEPLADARGSADYRRQIIAVFVRRALRVALGPVP